MLATLIRGKSLQPFLRVGNFILQSRSRGTEAAHRIWGRDPATRRRLEHWVAMKRMQIVLVSLSLLLAHVTAADAAKGGGGSYSSGGRSYSAGGSGGKSYSSGGSGGSGGKSYSAGGSSGGKSGSSPAGGSVGKSYSSGGGKTTYASPGGKSYSSGNKSTGSAVSPTPAAGAAVTSQKPAATSYDKLPAIEQKKAESRVAYQKAQQPKTTYTPLIREIPNQSIPRTSRSGACGSELDHERWVNRDQRERTFYPTYYSRPLVVYNDPYNSFFWLWLLDRSADDRAYWAYHHSYDMDPARYQELLTRDGQLEARIRQLEQQKVPRDPTYTPPALRDNTDLMYADDYVDAVYNPQPVPVASPGRSYSSRSSGDGSVFGRVFFWMFLILMIGAFIGLGVWLVFYKRWNV